MSVELRNTHMRGIKTTADLVHTASASGGYFLYANIQQNNDVALTGTLRGGYFVATNGTTAATGTIRGIEVKARAATSSNVGANVTTMEGAYLNADPKNKNITTMRGVQVVLDGAAGGTVTTAVGIEVNNNASNTQTASYGISFNEGSLSGKKAFTYDIRLQNGETIDNSTNGVVKIGGITQLGTAAIDASVLLAGTGTTSTKATTSTANKNFLGLWSETTATSGDSRGLYLRHYAGGTIATTGYSDAARIFGTVTGTGYSSATGAHITNQINTSASVTGLAAALRASLSVSGTTTQGTMCVLHLDEQGDFNGVYTDWDFVRVETSKTNLTAPRFLNFQGFTPGAGAMLVTGVAKAYPAEYAGTIKIKIGTTDYFIPLGSAQYS